LRPFVSDFVSNFGAYKGLASLDGLIYRPLDSVEASGDPGNAYSEAVRAGDVDVRASREATSEPSRYPLR
jgi:hypothetical protein